MKQWLLLTMISVCPEPHTLSNIGRLMGCSRQNVKKLITILEKKGYVIITEGSNNSICVELTNKVNKYSNDIGKKQIEKNRKKMIISMIILFNSVLSKEVLNMSSFPTLLLFTTVFRISLNVSSKLCLALLHPLPSVNHTKVTSFIFLNSDSIIL